MEQFSKKIRIELLKMLKHRGFGHIGGSLSIVEVLSVLYDKVLKIDPLNPLWEERDYFVLSKGHAGPALYATLALKGYFKIEDLLTLNEPHTSLPSHTDRLKTKGVDMTTGSLGQGFSSAVGIAKALKIQHKQNKVYVIVGDGELNEGQCYEAMQFASHHLLDNLVVFVDENKLQLDGFTEDICNPFDLRKKFEDFGFYACRCDGHNEQAILDEIKKAKTNSGRPTCIILETIKGKGVKELENTIGSHHVRFTEIENKMIDNSIKELEASIK
ncbi:MAG: transketolase [Firmicutes bacterium]|nr:transketolase [Bacillota bacterium]